jgi:hypothetical protein
MDISWNTKDSASVLVGLLDCIFGLGVALSDAGVVTREELAEAFETMVKQQVAQQKADPQNDPEARLLPTRTLVKLFRANVVQHYS